MTTPPRLVIFGYGNPSRGDDALGPLLLERAVRAAAERGQEVAVVEDFQLQVEDALELHGRELALFLDATQAGPAPFRFEALAAAEDPTYTTHAISPAAVLHAYRQIHGSAPPPGFVLAVRGVSFHLGEDLSAAAQVNLEAAASFLERLLEQPSPQRWRELAAEPV